MAINNAKEHLKGLADSMLVVWNQRIWHTFLWRRMQVHMPHFFEAPNAGVSGALF